MLLVALGLLIVTGLATLVFALRSAPDGFEDGAGFRESRPPFARRNAKKSARR